MPYNEILAPLRGCGSKVAYVYFITYMLLVSSMLLNLFITVILEGFDRCMQLEAGNAAGPGED